jgi:hypothetical protein
MSNTEKVTIQGLHMRHYVFGSNKLTVKRVRIIRYLSAIACNQYSTIILDRIEIKRGNNAFYFIINSDIFLM